MEELVLMRGLTYVTLINICPRNTTMKKHGMKATQERKYI